jgi:hypothetical protein
MKGYDQSE